MNLSILRGSSEIGGSCVKISSGDKTVVIDMGMPLYDKEGNKFDRRNARAALPGLSGLYARPYVDAILISHAHEDHYGLVSYSADGIPIFAGRGTQALLNISSLINGNKIDNSRFRTISDYQPFSVGPFEITPYLVDHSAYESMAFLIKAEGKSIFYSGDFRIGGPRKWVFDKFAKNYKVKTDVLLLEGTLIDSKPRESTTETDVFKKMSVEFARPHDGLTVAAYSSQNITRFCQIYKAAVKNNKELVLDPYGAYILEKLSKMSKNLPGPLTNNLRIYCVNNKISSKIFNEFKMWKFKKKKIGIPEIINNPEKFIITNRFAIFKNLKPHLKNCRLIWSMWDGYLKDNREFWDDLGAHIVPIHASGHADKEALLKFAKVIAPDTIIPIHTTRPEMYKKVFNEYNVHVSGKFEVLEI